MEALRLITVSDCEKDLCGESHIGKFSSCRDWALHGMSLDGAGETTGHADFGVHAALMGFDHAVAVASNGFAVMIPAGGYLIFTHQSGAVLVSHYVDAQDASAEFEAIDARYVEYLNHEDTHPAW